MKEVVSQVLFKGIGQLGQCRAEVVMCSGSARLFADMLLRLQVGSSHRIFDNFQAWLGGQELANGRARMPGRTVPNQANRNAWESVQDALQMRSTGARRQLRAARDQVMSSAQVKPAVEADFGSFRVNAHLWGVAKWRPDTHRRGLQVHPGFILTQHPRLRPVLRHVNQIFQPWLGTRRHRTRAGTGTLFRCVGS